MLQSLCHILDFTLKAQDGDIGKIHDFYFDDHAWMVRYLVSGTGEWLRGKKVLISPASAGQVDWAGRRVAVSLTRRQVRESPDAATDRPLSRQLEEELTAHYGWPAYWTMGTYGVQPMSAPLLWPDEAAAPAPAQFRGDPHLRSVREMIGYHADAAGGSLGQIANFVFDDESWAIAFVAIALGPKSQERQVLVEPLAIEKISCAAAEVSLRLPLDSVITAPEWDGRFPVSPAHAGKLREHYRGGGARH